MTDQKRTVAGLMIDTLREIACGRTDRGIPLAGETSRQLARTALLAAGVDWPSPVRPTKPKLPAIQTEDTRP